MPFITPVFSEIKPSLNEGALNTINSKQNYQILNHFDLMNSTPYNLINLIQKPLPPKLIDLIQKPEPLNPIDPVDLIKESIEAYLGKQKTYLSGPCKKSTAFFSSLEPNSNPLITSFAQNIKLHFELKETKASELTKLLIKSKEKDISIWSDHLNAPSYGPLTQNIATRIIATLVELCLNPGEGVCFELDKQFQEVRVRLPNAMSFNLSLLLKNADLNQLKLDEKLLNWYGDFLENGTFKHIPTQLPGILPPHLSSLHPSLLKAINLYTSALGGFYRLINSLCRGQLLKEFTYSSSFDASLVKEAFLVAVIGSYGLMKSYALQVESRSLAVPVAVTQDTQKPSPPLYRGIEHRPPVGLFFREQALFSTSRLQKDGFGSCRPNVVSLEQDTGGIPIASISQVPTEEEVLFPAGTTLLYTPVPNSKNKFTAKVVRTPDLLDSEGHYALVEEGLRYVYDKHFSLSTDDNIVKPNHGIIHIMRTIAYADSVVDYFRRYAKPEFTAYFNELSSLKTKMALTFYITGRESEIAFADNPSLYRKYRAASAAHFEEYIKASAPKYQVVTDDPRIQWNPDEIALYTEVLKNAGDPHYLADLIEHGYEDAANGFKLALWSVLTLSHCLDLPRCYRALEYQIATTKKFQSIIQESSQQSVFLTSLYSFALELIQATDDDCFCGLDSHNKLIDISSGTNRGMKFAYLSLNLSKCEETIFMLAAQQNMALTRLAKWEAVEGPVYQQRCDLV